MPIGVMGRKSLALIELTEFAVFEGMNNVSLYVAETPRENEVREHIPVSYDNRLSKLFLVGPMAGGAGNGQRSSGCVHLNKKLII